jgi:hypothetical protein
MSEQTSQVSQESTTAAWTREDVERWLTDYPLPANFTYNGARAYPRYRLRCGYGQWLRTAGPYHAALRGLFGLVCDIIIGWPVGQPLPTPDELAQKIREAAAAQGELIFSEEDLARPSGLRHPDEETTEDTSEPEQF